MKPDSHGWMAVGLFALTGWIFWLMHIDPKMAQTDLFKMLAEAVVVTGLINLACSFYYGASKNAPQQQAPQGGAS